MGHIKTETAMGEKKRKPEAEIMMAYLARNYRRSLMRLDLCRMEGISESRLIYEADHSYVCLIERALADCSPSTRQIINEETEGGNRRIPALPSYLTSVNILVWYGPCHNRPH